MNARALVGAMFTPQCGEQRPLHTLRRSAEELIDSLILIARYRLVEEVMLLLAQIAASKAALAANAVAQEP